MQGLPYNIDEVKKYFFYYAYWKNGRTISEEEFKRYSEKPYFLLSEKIGGIALCLFIGGLGLYLLLSYILSSISQGGMNYFEFIMGFIPIFPFFFFPFIVGLHMYKRASRIGKLSDYFELKLSNNTLLEEFRKTTENDRADPNIDPLQIEKIQKILSQIQKTTKLLIGPLVEFRKISREYSKEQRRVLEKFIELETVSTILYIKNFEEILALWMIVHKTELEERENLLKNTSNPLLGLTSKRLEVEKGILERSLSL